MLTKKREESVNKFICKNCDFSTCRKSDYERHLLTEKHKMLTNIDKNTQKSTKNNLNEFSCECGKIYKHRQSLSVHKKKCNIEQNCSVSKISSALEQELQVAILKKAALFEKEYSKSKKKFKRKSVN